VHDEQQLTRCLVIGSSDSSGAAGIQGDIKALASIGCYATTVVVGVTAQDTTGVHRRWSVPSSLVVAQLECVLEDIGADAVKIGTVWSAAVLEGIARGVAPLNVPVVVDPVLFSAAGSALFHPGAVQVLKQRLFPIATVVVPNREEARFLVGDLAGELSVSRLAERLVEQGAAAVLITGGGGQEPYDWLFDGHAHHRIDGTRYDNGVGHGAGCAHAAILAGSLGRGYALTEAARMAKRRAEHAVRDGAVGLGRGIKPVDAVGLRQQARILETSEHDANRHSLRA
jgi:hydroxymethylpyrimidine/phosphomethylpyrimidine kinase